MSINIFDKITMIQDNFRISLYMGGNLHHVQVRKQTNQSNTLCTQCMQQTGRGKNQGTMNIIASKHLNSFNVHPVLSTRVRLCKATLSIL